MKLSWSGIAALLGCLIGAVVPLPKRAEGVRFGIFAAVLAFVVIDSARRRAATADRSLVPVMNPEITSLEGNPTADRAERLRRASRLLENATPTSASAQWRRFGQLARSHEGGVKNAA